MHAQFENERIRSLRCAPYNIDSPEIVKTIRILGKIENQQIDIVVYVSLNIPCQSHKCNHNR